MGDLGPEGFRTGPAPCRPEPGGCRRPGDVGGDDADPFRTGWETDESCEGEARGWAAALGTDEARGLALAGWRRCLIRADLDEAARLERAVLRGASARGEVRGVAGAGLALAAFSAVLQGNVVRGERLARQALRGATAGLGRGEALLALGTAQMARGQLVRAGVALDEALTVLSDWLAERARSPHGAGGTGGAGPHQGAAEGAATGGAAAGGGRRRDEAAGVAVRAACLAALLRCYLHLWAGEKGEAAALAERWLAAAADGLPAAEARGTAVLATAAVLLDAGDARGSVQAAEEAASLLQRAGHLVLLARARDQQALGHLVLGAPDTAAGLLARSRALQETTSRTWLAYTLLNGARVFLEAGRLDEARGWVEAALGRVGRGRDEHLLPSARVLQAEVLRRSGDEGGATEALAAALEAVARHGLDNCVRSYLAPALGSLTSLAARLPALLAGVRRALVELAATAGPGPAPAAEETASGFRRTGVGNGRGHDPAAVAVRVPLRLRLLGRFELEVGGVPVPGDVLRAAAPRRLLAYLVLNRDCWLTRDGICDALWPESDPQSAQRMFYGALKQCRGALAVAGLAGEDVVVCSAGCYTVAPAIDAWVDAAAFEELGREGLARPPEQALPLIREALALWGGPFLPGVGRCAWTEAVRSRLDALRRDLLLARARALLSLGRVDEARHACLACLAEEPRWEEALRLLDGCR